MFQFIHRLRQKRRRAKPEARTGGAKSRIPFNTAIFAGGLLALSIMSGALWAANVTVAGVLAGDINVDSRGSLDFELPLKTAPGYNNLTPKLALAYSSRNNQSGVLGVGWQLNGLSSIYRCGKSLQLDETVGPVQYDDGDRLCQDGNRMIASTGASDGQYWSTSAKYYTYDENWMEILPSAHTCGGEVCYFQATRKDGTTLFYGLDDTNARSAEPVSGKYGRWHLNKIRDRNGNDINISYTKESGVAYPNQITYNSGFLIQFRYESSDSSVYDREIAWATDNSGVAQSTAKKRLNRIEMWKDLNRYKVYELSYTTSDSTKRSLLNKIEECDSVDNGECFEPVDIDWNQYDWHAAFSDGAKFRRKYPTQNIYQQDLKGVYYNGNNPEGTQLYPGDYDGDGRTDFIKMKMGDWSIGASDSFCVYYAKSGTETTGEFDRVCPSATYSIGGSNYSYQTYLKGTHGGGGDGVRIIVGDFNADGRADFVRQEFGSWANNSTNTLNVFLSKGTRDGVFDVITPTGASEQSKLRGTHGTDGNGVNLIPGDFDGDGRTDLAAQQYGDWADTDDGDDHGQDFVLYYSSFLGQSGSFTDYFPTGNGMNASASIFHGGTDESDDGVYMIPGDFNGDGLTDFIRQEFGSWAVDDVRSFEVYFGLASGEFRYGSYSGHGTDFQKFLKGKHGSDDNGTNIILGDYNGDGKSDFIAQRFNEWSLAANTADDDWIFRVCISKGDGDFDCKIPNVGDGVGVNLDRMAGLERQQDFWRHAFNDPNIGTTVIPGDFNGDGKTDFIRQEGWALGEDTVGNFEVQLSAGDGINWDQFTPSGSIYQTELKAASADNSCNTFVLNECHPGSNILTGDYDGDGRLDFLKQEFGEWAENNDSDTFAVYLNPHSLSPVGHPSGTSVAQPADTIQQITQGKKETIFKYLAMTGLAPSGGTLTAIGSGIGCSGSFCFRTSPNGRKWLVAQVIENPIDTDLNSRTSDYIYGTPVSGNEGGFLGFREIEVTQPERDLRVLTTYEFHAAGDYRAGRTNWTRTYNNTTGTEIRRNMLGWTLATGRLSGSGNSTYWMRVHAEHDFDFGYSNGSGSNTFKRERNFTHSATNGNVTEIEDKYPGAPTVYTCTDYYPEDTVNWVLDEVQRVTVGDASGCATPLKKTEFTYDSNGNVTTEKEFFKTSDSLTTTYQDFTSGGLPETVILPSGLVKSLEYDANGHVESVSEVTLTTTFTNDPKWGQWTSKTDPNGRVFSRSFDSFGRLETVSAPDNATTPSSVTRRTVSYAWNGEDLVQSTATRVKWNGNERIEKVFRNAWGNEVRKTVEATGEDTIRTDHFYNERDQKTGESLPYFENDVGTRRDFLYSYGDAFFRLTAVALGPNTSGTGSLTNTTMGYTTGSGCPAGNQRVSRFQGNRTTISCKDFRGQTTRMEYVADEGTKVQTWTHDEMGRVTQSSDTLSVTTTEYDLLGRKTSVDNNQRGEEVYQYQKSWGGILRRINYYDTDGTRTGRWRIDDIDALKRPTQIGRNVYESDGTTVANRRRTIYSYDDAGACAGYANAKGRVCKTKVQRRIGSSGPYTALLNRTYKYDNSGNVKTLKTRLKQPDLLYTMKYKYGPDGQRTKVTYPNGREAKYSYDNMGRLTQVQEQATGSTVYATYSEYSPTGRAGEVFVNDSAVKETRSYDDYNRLSNIEIEKVGGAAHLDQALDYTGFGEVDTVDGDLVGNSIFFDYDYNRWGYLTDAESTGYQNYGTLSFGYDSSGRLSTKDGKTYTYDSTRQYRVTSRTGADNLSLSYNKTGSVSSRTQSGTTTDYEYSYNQQLLKVTQGASTIAEFEYDEDGKRWMKKDTATSRTHYYITPEIDVQDNNGTWIASHYIMGQEGRIAALSDSGTGATALLQQHNEHRMLASEQSLKSVAGLLKWSYHTAAMYVLHPAFPDAAGAALMVLTLLGIAAFAWFFVRSARQRSVLGGLRWRTATALASVGLISNRGALAFRRAAGTNFMRRYRRLSLALPLALLSMFSFQCAQNDQAVSAGVPGLHPGMIGFGANGLNGLPQAGEDRYFHANRTGNVHLVTNQNGDVVSTPIYKPFGEVHFVGSFNDTRPKFQGKELDHTTNLYYFGARYYDPDLGRFMQADSMAVGTNAPHAANLDRYAAFGNNPMAFTDPTGNLGLLTTGLLIWAVSTIVSFSVAAISAAIFAKRNNGEVDWGALFKEEAIGAAISLAFVGLGAGYSAGKTLAFTAKRSFMSNLKRLAHSPFRKALGRVGAYARGTTLALAEATASSHLAQMATSGNPSSWDMLGEAAIDGAKAVAFGQAIGLGTSGIKGFYNAKYDVDLNPDFSKNFELPLAQRRQLESELYAAFGGLNGKTAKYDMARILTQSSEGSALFRQTGYLRNVSPNSAFNMGMGRSSMIESPGGFVRSTFYGAVVGLAEGPFNENILYGNHFEENE